MQAIFYSAITSRISLVFFAISPRVLRSFPAIATRILPISPPAISPFFRDKITALIIMNKFAFCPP